MPTDLENTDAAPDNVRDDVATALASLKGETPLPLATSDDAPASDAGADENAPPPTDTRPRNERGQFIKADGTVDPDQGPAKTADKPVSDADPAQATDRQQSNAAVAPSSWSASAKAKFATLDPDIQAEINKREADMHAGGQKWSGEKQTLLSYFEPVRAAAERYQAHPGEVIKRLAAANEYLERDPVGAIKWLADAYKVDLSKPLTEQSSAPRPQADPVLLQLSEKVSSLEGYFQQQEQNRVAETLQTFATQPGHEHYEAVKADMGRLMMVAMQTGREMTLQDAYDQAVWANPTTRTSMLASQNAGAAAAQKQREAAEKARRGAISANGSPGSPLAPARRDTGANSSVADDVKAAIEQLRVN